METNSEILWLNAVLHAALYVSVFPKDAFVPFLLSLNHQMAALNSAGQVHKLERGRFFLYIHHTAFFHICLSLEVEVISAHNS